MHVLICGAGRVGQGIARRLAREKHEITIIDESPDLVDQVSIDLDVRGIVGHAAHPDVLKRARAAETVATPPPSREEQNVAKSFSLSSSDHPSILKTGDAETQETKRGRASETGARPRGHGRSATWTGKPKSARARACSCAIVPDQCLSGGCCDASWKFCSEMVPDRSSSNSCSV